MISFNELSLPVELDAALIRMNFTTPTPIQAQAIPMALEGRDILGSAQTGTGKTAAFCIPLVAHLLKDPKATALVMTPTRELATQVMTVAQQLVNRDSGIRTALLIGGDSMVKQFKQLNNRPRLIIGTPGRINDHLRRNKAMLSESGFLVLDEADRMLDMGFSVQIDEILKYLPKERQTLMFSATLPRNIVEFSKRYLKDPARVAVESAKPTADNIDHQMLRLSTDEKYPELIKQITSREGSIIIFVKTKRNADKLARKLQDENMNAEAIHGDLKQSRRDRVIKEFREKSYRILVATDVAARGLDVPHIEHVINFDLPQVAEDYIHRIGRTARAGAKGHAICFVTSADAGMWNDINRILDPSAANDESFRSKPARRGSSRNRSGGGGGYKGDFKKRDGFKGGGFKSRDGFKKEGFKKDFSSDKRQNGDSPSRVRVAEDRGQETWSNRGERPQRNDRPQRDDRPRREGGEFRKPREDGNFKPRREDTRDENRGNTHEGHASRDERWKGESRGPKRGPFKPREDGGYKPRREGGEFRKPREGGEFRPRREEGNFKPRSEGGFKSDRPQRDDRPRREEGEFRPRREEGGFKPRGDRDDRPRNDRPRDDRPRGERPEGRSEGQRTPFAKDGKKPFRTFDGAKGGFKKGPGGEDKPFRKKFGNGPKSGQNWNKNHAEKAA